MNSKLSPRQQRLQAQLASLTPEQKAMMNSTGAFGYDAGWVSALSSVNTSINTSPANLSPMASNEMQAVNTEDSSATLSEPFIDDDDINACAAMRKPSTRPNGDYMTHYQASLYLEKKWEKDGGSQTHPLPHPKEKTKRMGAEQFSSTLGLPLSRHIGSIVTKKTEGDVVHAFTTALTDEVLPGVDHSRIPLFTFDVLDYESDAEDEDKETEQKSCATQSSSTLFSPIPSSSTIATSVQETAVVEPVKFGEKVADLVVAAPKIVGTTPEDANEKVALWLAQRGLNVMNVIWAEVKKEWNIFGSQRTVVTIA
ncbi:hypothetical protein BT69DRAFT_1293790 [Atractiella rhizophila]|nr:hypothetical protein BT69DRAFT_1293790 [Atractiella rhizophila]